VSLRIHRETGFEEATGHQLHEGNELDFEAIPYVHHYCGKILSPMIIVEKFFLHTI
jgi:hypothetical protein